MTDQHKENSSDVLQTSAAAAHAVSGAVKTGKAAAQIAKGAAAGGPYGAAASALWEGMWRSIRFAT